MGQYSAVGIWTECPACRDEAVAVVRFHGSAEARARLVDFRCPMGCDVDESRVLGRLRLRTLDRAS